MASTYIEPDRQDPTGLSDHFRQCEFACGFKHQLLCVFEALDAFFAPRFVTTLTVVTAFVVVAAALP